jgi:hypothetical protein
MSSRIVWPVLLLGGTLLLACTEATPNHCQNSSDCSGGKVCDVARAVCVSPDAAAAPMDGLHEPVGIVDASRVSDISVAIEVSVALDAQYADAPYTTEVNVAADAPLSGEAGGTKLPVDTATIDVAVPDVYVPDAAGTCGSSGDCTDPSKAFCVAGVCVGCQTGLDGGANACMGPNTVCDSVSGRCVGCTADTHCTSTASPICNKTSNTCAVCTLDAQCKSKNAALPACQADGRCVQCTSNASCGGATPVCDTTTNTCVQCTSAANCSGATPICGSNNKCQACVGDGECGALNDPARSTCAASGACVQCTAANSTQCAGTTAVCNTTTNKCVQCLASTSCSGATPICATATNTCRGCSAASDCVTLGIAGHLACGSSGACVQCTDNTTCSGVTPICATSTNSCRACAADSECSAIGPGVCMSQSDGHCATDTETVYVGTLGGATCNESNAGTAQAPVCSLQSGVGLAKSGSSSKPVVAVRGTLAAGSTNIAVTAPLTIVGKNSAVLTPAATGADAIDITSGEIYLRNLTIQGTASPKTGIGINAAPTSGNAVSLHMRDCRVTNNPGGGVFLSGAAFDVENTIITGNGAGQTTGGLVWGGIRVDSLPTSGPTVLNLVTVQNNNAVGISCSGNITGTGVLATGNTSAEIANSCGFSSCTPAPDGGTGCGAQ